MDDVKTIRNDYIDDGRIITITLHNEEPIELRKDIDDFTGIVFSDENNEYQLTHIAAMQKKI